MSFNEKKSLKEKFEIYAESYAKELDDLELYDLKNFSTNCCPDIIAAGRNGEFWFSKEKRYENKDSLDITDENIPTIVIILESPHKDEFNNQNFPNGNPALGKTGKMLQEHFKAILRKNISELPNNYRVILMNSIQFQCSLGEVPKKYRDYMWLSLWFGTNNLFKNDFICRLNSYNPSYIFNFCTIGNHIKKEYIELCLQKCSPEICKKSMDDIQNMKKITIRSIVNSSIPQNIILFEGSHPSSWWNRITIKKLF